MQGTWAAPGRGSPEDLGAGRDGRGQRGGRFPPPTGATVPRMRRRRRWDLRIGQQRKAARIVPNHDRRDESESLGPPLNATEAGRNEERTEDTHAMGTKAYFGKVPSCMRSSHQCTLVHPSRRKLVSSLSHHAVGIVGLPTCAPHLAHGRVLPTDRAFPGTWHGRSHAALAVPVSVGCHSCQHSAKVGQWIAGSFVLSTTYYLPSATQLAAGRRRGEPRW